MNGEQDRNIVEEILSGTKLSATPTQRDIVDEVLSGPGTPDIKKMPLDSVMTPVGKQTIGASFLTQLKTGLVDDPQTQMKIYAATRFPDLSEEERLKRYGIHKGEIVYLGKDDKIYRETPDSWLEKAKRFAAQEGAHLPSYILGVLGFAGGGLGGAAVGAGAGELIRKEIAGQVYDEPQTPAGLAKDVGLEAGLAAGGEIVGRGVGRVISRVGRKRAGRLAVEAGRDIAKVDLNKVEAVRKRAKKFGIDLLPPQTTESQELINKFTLLGDLERSADFIREAKRLQVQQIDNAVYRFLDDIAPATSPYKAGKEAVEAARAGIRRPVNIRRAKAAPIYKKAFQEAPDVNIESVITHIDEKLRTAKGDVRGHLQRAKELLMKPDIEEGAEILDTSLRGLHDSKLSIDTEIAKAKRTGLGNTIRKNYQDVKALLLKEMDKASPDYGRARRVFSEYSEEVEKQAKKTLAGEVSKLEGDQVLQASRRLLGSTWSSPETVKKARLLIQKENPEAWDAVLRVHLQDIFEGIKGSALGDIPNLGGWMHKKTFGNIRQRKILEAAMSPEQYKTLEDFMDILRRTGLIFRKESATAPRQVVLKHMEQRGQSKALMAATRPLYTYQRIIGDRVNELLFGKYQENLAKAMLSEDVARELKRLKRLSPKSEKYVKGLGVLLGLITGHEAGRQRETPEDIMPRAISGTQ